MCDGYLCECVWWWGVSVCVCGGQICAWVCMWDGMYGGVCVCGSGGV